MPISKRVSFLLAAGACLAALAGAERWARADERATGKAPPAGGFAPAPMFYPPGRASSYWPHEGKPVDMENPWRELKEDEYHDPTSTALPQLQNPVEAMKDLPRARTGNYIDWVKALESGAIKPRADVDKPGQMEVSDLVVTLRDTRTMPTVTFSHTVHTQWLACSNCHDELFKRKAGATDIRMVDIFKGKACGVCHGKVAFPPDLCFRCHDGPRPKAQN